MASSVIPALEMVMWVGTRHPSAAENQPGACGLGRACAVNRDSPPVDCKQELWLLRCCTTAARPLVDLSETVEGGEFSKDF
jgi:hypothetical protein